MPPALQVGYGISWLQPDGLMPGTVIGYWLSNVLGIVMMQLGATDLWVNESERRPQQT